MHPMSREVIERAAARCGQTLQFKAERGGTTAAMLAAKDGNIAGGMNIYSGQHLAHSTHEYAVLEEMMDSYRLLLHIVNEVANMQF